MEESVVSAVVIVAFAAAVLKLESISVFRLFLTVLHRDGDRSRRLGDENEETRVLEDDSSDCFDRYSLRRLLLVIPTCEKAVCSGLLVGLVVVLVFVVVAASLENNARDNLGSLGDKNPRSVSVAAEVAARWALARSREEFSRLSLLPKSFFRNPTLTIFLLADRVKSRRRCPDCPSSPSVSFGVVSPSGFSLSW